MKTLMIAAALSLGLLSAPTSEKHEGKEKHPHIRAAIHELQLQRANHDFGGHRAQALEALTWPSSSSGRRSSTTRSSIGP